MKKFASVLLMLAFSALAFAATRSATLEVQGWTCGTCASATKIALKKLDGVTNVTTDVEKSEVVVTYEEGKVSTQKMIEAVGKIGYRARVKAETGDKSRP
jgi:mercuric transport protein